MGNVIQVNCKYFNYLLTYYLYLYSIIYFLFTYTSESVVVL